MAGTAFPAQIQAHRDALKLALASGCNLIDTSTNYGDGQSELLIGEVIQELTGNQQIKREDLVVVTKIGYVQGENLTLAQQRKERGLSFKKWSNTVRTVALYPSRIFTRSARALVGSLEASGRGCAAFA